MSSVGAGIALGCTSCAVDLFLEAQDELELRAGLARFFAEHESCDVFMDVSRCSVPLPRPPA